MVKLQVDCLYSQTCAAKCSSKRHELKKRECKDWEDAMKFVDAKKDDLQQNNLFAIKLKQWYISWRWKHDL